MELREATIIVREPILKDGAEIYDLVKASPPLDLNSQYFYFLFSSYFAKQGAVAVVEGKIIGGLLGFIPPEKPDRYFVWQVFVSEDYRGCGIAEKLLDHILGRKANTACRYVEATVGGSNTASLSFFNRFAKRKNVELKKSSFLTKADFKGGDHEEEDLLTIGPLPPLTDRPDI